METKEEIEKLCRFAFPDWSDEEVNKYVKMMFEKYSTIKRGDNVIHLDYYEGIITLIEIAEIEKSLKNYNLELSRFDKSGIAAASVEDFNLHIAIFLSDPIVQNILLGLGTNALWDTIKQTTFFIWAKIKQRVWDRQSEQGRKSMLNFGIKVRLDKNTSFDLKIDGDLSEELVLEALDKTIDFLKSTKRNETPQRDNFYVFNTQKKVWKKVDTMQEIRKKFELEKDKKKKNMQ